MNARVLDGNGTAAQIKNELKDVVDALRKRGIVPGLGLLLVGDDPASRSYVTGKQRDCEEVGVRPVSLELPASASHRQIVEAVRSLNDDPGVNGFIVQLPLPPGIPETEVLEKINPEKDADGLHPMNLGRLVLAGNDSHPTQFPLPCTPAGILELLIRHNIDLAGKHVTVIGRGLTVGRPLGLLLTRKGIDATVTLAHSRTSNLVQEVGRSDIVIAAVGVPHLVKADWVKPGAVVLDVGVTRTGTTPSGKAKLSGDVDPEVGAVAGWLSPNPGGVGPMTRAMLVANVVSMASTDVTTRRSP